MRWVAMALSYNGLLFCCLAMSKHYRHVFSHAPTGTRRLLFKMTGWLMLIGSFVTSVMANGWSFGPVEWIGGLAVTGLMLVFLLPYAPRVAALFGLVIIPVQAVCLL